MLYSPINYSGNKSRIVDKLLQYIPKDTDKIVEVFAGSAILSFASDIKDIYLNDTNHYILDLIQYFHDESSEQIIADADNIIKEYGLTNSYYEGKEKYPEEKHEGLSKFNKNAFQKLKADYNHDKDIKKLFVLTIYGFNHYIRFNGKDEYNIPVGKVDFVKSLRDKTISYSDAVKSKTLHISNLDFRNENLYKNIYKNTFLYFDPPYLITEATYNPYWTEDDEKDLLNLLDDLNEQGYKFMLSNVVESNGKTNEILKKWMKKYTVIDIHRQYLNSSYQKKNLSNAREVIILNYKEDIDHVERDDPWYIG